MWVCVCNPVTCQICQEVLSSGAFKLVRGCLFACLFVHVQPVSHTLQPKITETEPLTSRLSYHGDERLVSTAEQRCYGNAGCLLGGGPPLIRANERQIDRTRDGEKTTVRARHSVYSQSRFCPVFFSEALPSFLHGWIIAASLSILQLFICCHYLLVHTLY